jgi:hypothetical protein
MKQVTIGVARISNVLFRLIVPAFTAATRAVGDFVKYLSQHETAVKAFFIMLSGLIIGLLLPSILSFFGALLTNPITWVILLLGLLAIAIEDLVGWVNGKKSAFGDFWTSIFGSPEEAMQTFDEVKQAVMDFVNFMKTDGKEMAKPFIELGQWLMSIPLDNLKSIADFVRALNSGSMFDILSAGVEMFVQLVFSSVRLAFNIIGEFLQFVADEAVLALQYMMEGVKAYFEEGMQSLSATANSVVEAIKGFFVGLKDSIISAIGEAIDWALDKLAELAAAVRATPIIGGAVDYVFGGGGGTTNNTVSSKYNVIVNTQATDAEGTGRAVGNAMMGYNARMANGGSY